MSDGPHCQIWTPEDVRRWLVAAMIALPTTPIYSKPGGRVGVVCVNVPDATFDWIGFLNAVVTDYKLRLAVLVWAKMEARREAKARKLKIEIPATGINEFCREYGWTKPFFYRRVEAGVTLLARERTLRSAPDEMAEAA